MSRKFCIVGGALAAGAMMAAAVPAEAQIPAYTADPVLETRTRFADGFNWPARGAFSQLELNNDGQILVRGTISTGSGYFINVESALWYGSVGSGGSVFRDLNASGTGANINAVNLNEDGTAVAFERFFGAGPSGFYTFPPTYTLATTEFGGGSSFSVADIYYSEGVGLIGMRDGSSRLLTVDPATDSSNVFYDFAAAGQTGGSTVWNESLTATTRITESGVGSLASIDLGGSVTSITDTTVGSLGGFSMNNAGDVAFFQSIGGVNTLRVWSKADDTITDLFGVGDVVGSITVPTFDFFAPDISDSGLIVFRASGQIFVTDTTGSDLVRLIGVGDAVMTDLGATTISGLALAPRINADGVVLFASSLSGGFGSAVFTIVPEPASLALLGLGGLALLRRRVG